MTRDLTPLFEEARAIQDQIYQTEKGLEPLRKRLMMLNWELQRSALEDPTEERKETTSDPGRTTDPPKPRATRLWATSRPMW